MDDPSAFSGYESDGLTNIYHILRAPRRRLLVIILAQDGIPVDASQSLPIFDQQRPLSVRDVSRLVTAIEQGVPLNHATGDPYHSVYTSLTQTHLPALHEADAIEYDADRKTLRVTPNLIPIASIAAISTPVASLFLDETSMSLIVRNGHASLRDSIGD